MLLVALRHTTVLYIYSILELTFKTMIITQKPIGATDDDTFTVTLRASNGVLLGVVATLSNRDASSSWIDRGTYFTPINLIL